MNYVASGGLTLGGSSSTTSSSWVTMGAGGLSIGGGLGEPTSYGVPMQLGGEVTLEVNYIESSSGGLVIGGTAGANEDNIYAYAGSGSLTIGGTSSEAVSYIETAAGTITIGGTADSQQSIAYIAAGGLIFGGAATTMINVNANSGGTLILGGAATANLTYMVNASGSLTIGGSATVSQDAYVYNASGILTISGSATTTQNFPYVSSGTLTIGGEISITTSYPYTSSGGLTIGGTGYVVATIYSTTGSGELVIGGTAAAAINSWHILASGGLILSGTADAEFIVTPETTGGIVVGGEATYSVNYIYISSGTLILSGTLVSAQDSNYAGTGGLILGGAATAMINVNASSGGTLILGGEAGVEFILSVTSDGGLILGGEAGVEFILSVTSDGGLILGGVVNVQNSDYAANGNGGLVIGGEAELETDFLVYAGGGTLYLGGEAPALTPISIDKDFTWNVFNSIVVDKDFTWNVSTPLQSWYRVQGKCKLSECDPIGFSQAPTEETLECVDTSLGVVSNAGFESLPISPWTSSVANATVGTNYDPDHANSGKRSLKISNTGPSFSASIQQAISSGFFVPDRSYELSAYVKSESESCALASSATLSVVLSGTGLSSSTSIDMLATGVFGEGFIKIKTAFTMVAPVPTDVTLSISISSSDAIIFDTYIDDVDITTPSAGEVTIPTCTDAGSAIGLLNPDFEDDFDNWTVTESNAIAQIISEGIPFYEDYIWSGQKALALISDTLDDVFSVTVEQPLGTTEYTPGIEYAISVNLIAISINPTGPPSAADISLVVDLQSPDLSGGKSVGNVTIINNSDFLEYEQYTFLFTMPDPVPSDLTLVIHFENTVAATLISTPIIILDQIDIYAFGTEEPDLPVVCDSGLLCDCSFQTIGPLNGGLESWSGGSPVSWSASTSPGASITQSSDVHEGGSAARMSLGDEINPTPGSAIGVTNHDFEDGLSGWSIAAQTNAEFIVNEDEFNAAEGFPESKVFSGSQSLSIKATYPEYNIQLEQLLEEDPFSPGVEYTVTVWIKAINVSGTDSELIIDLQSPDFLGGSSTEKIIINSDVSTFTQYTLDFGPLPTSYFPEDLKLVIAAANPTYDVDGFCSEFIIDKIDLFAVGGTADDPVESQFAILEQNLDDSLYTADKQYRLTAWVKNNWLDLGHPVNTDFPLAFTIQLEGTGFGSGVSSTITIDDTYGNNVKSISKYLEKSFTFTMPDPVPTDLVLRVIYTGASSDNVAFETNAYVWVDAITIDEVCTIDAPEEGLPCYQNFTTNIMATGLGDLCSKLREQGFIWPISSIHKFTTPAQITTGEVATCNQLVDVTPDVNDVPEECLDFFLDQFTIFSVGANAIALEAAIYSYVATGGLYLFEAPLPTLNVGIGTSGAITLGGTSGNPTVADLNGFELEDLSIYIGADPEAVDEGATFTVVDAPLFNPVAPLSFVTTCCDVVVPISIQLNHNLNLTNNFSQFLFRNDLILPSSVVMTYNRITDLWQSNYNFRGLAATVPEEQIWNIVFEFGCKENVGIGSSTAWKFSMSVSNKNLDTDEDFVSRLLVFFTPDNVCEVGEPMNFSFSVNTTTDTSNPSNVYDLILTDDVGLFKSPYWISNPNLLFNVSSTIDSNRFTYVDYPEIYIPIRKVRGAVPEPV